MLALVDESGDTGMKFDGGSSRFFVVSIVIFKNDEEALRCSERIQLAKKELGYSGDFEFHFNSNSRSVREIFLNAVAPYPFLYTSIVIDKTTHEANDDRSHHSSFYRYACRLVFENAEPYLKNARIGIDRSGGDVFMHELAKYLVRTINEHGQCIKSVKMRSASTDNLLQLADYVAGITSRKVRLKKNFEIYQNHIQSKEVKHKAG